MGTQTTNTASQSTTNAQGNGGLPLPQSDRDVEHLQGHWLLARIGKRVLRPGGKKLTGRMLAKTELEGKDVVEFAPGLIEKVPENKREALIGILSQDPRPGYEDDPERRYGVEFAGMDVRFHVRGDVLKVCEIVPAGGAYSPK